ncbi:MAG: bifunctional DNA primase/helicase [Hyphomicrobiales bacterium]|nr:bifunctional DNA primase/helicase [Hyphomicrobiales bacterium]
MSESAVAWIDSRGIDPELASKFGLESYRNDDGGEVLVFPYFVGGEQVNRKHRKLPKERFWQDTDATKCFWNYNVLVDPTLADAPLIITEGEPDALVAIQCGFVRTMSVPDGAPARRVEDAEATRKYTYLDHGRGGLRDCREIILAVDGDEPGMSLMNDLALRIGKAKCKWVRYPKGCKDLNDTLLKYGERGVHEVFKRAQWCKVDGIYRMSELPPYPDRQQYETGFDWLRPHYRIRMGDFCVVTGRPGDGKTTWVNDLLCRVVETHGWTVAIASFEQHPQSDYRRALREWFCKRPLTDGAGRELVSPEEVAQADKWIDKHFIFIVPDDDDLANLEWVLDKCAAAVIRHGCRVISIDPWNELDHDRPHDVSLTEYTGRAIKEFKRLARHLDVHVIVVAHPTKLGAGEKPGLYSISDSAHWANKPDVGIVIWKPTAESDRAELRVAKSRYHTQIGKPGSVWMRYAALTRRFDVSEEPKPDGDGK